MSMTPLVGDSRFLAIGLMECRQVFWFDDDEPDVAYIAIGRFCGTEVNTYTCLRIRAMPNMYGPHQYNAEELVLIDFEPARHSVAALPSRSTRTVTMRIPAKCVRIRGWACLTTRVWLLRDSAASSIPIRRMENGNTRSLRSTRLQCAWQWRRSSTRRLRLACSRLTLPRVGPFRRRSSLPRLMSAGRRPRMGGSSEAGWSTF